MPRIYEAMTHAVSCAVVLGNEPANVRGEGIRQGRRVRASGEVRSFSVRKPDQSDPVLNGILHRTFLKLRCGKEHGFLRAKRHLFGMQHLHVLTLDPICVVLAFHDNEKIRPENPESGCYIDFIGAIVPVNRLPVFRYKLPQLAGGRFQVLFDLQFKLE